MAVLIPDMEMPECCIDCPMTIMVDADFGEYECILKGETLGDVWGEPPKTCPLVEIPRVKTPLTDKESEDCNFEL